MARDGSGTYTRVVTPPVNGDVADADDYNAEQDDIADALTDSINAAGTKAFGANQSMGGFRLTDLATPSSANDAARKAYVDSAITAAAQPLDPLLTAIAALTTADDRMLDFTGTDTVAVVTYATVLSNIGATTLAAALAAVQANANTFTQQQIISSGATVVASILDATGAAYQQWKTGGVSRFYIGTDATNLVVLDGAAATLLQINLSSKSASFIGAVTAPIEAVTGVNGTLTTAHRNVHCDLSGDVTMPNSVFTAKDKQTFDPGTSNRTFTRGSGVTMYVNGVDSATATLSANQMGGAHWRTASVVVLTGAFS